MKVAVFGGSGFLGYDFVRLALREGGCEPVVYSSSAKSLSNIARHEVDIRLYPSADPGSVSLDPDVEVLINFSHPFERRDGISGLVQVERFAAFVAGARQRNPRLRLIHTSSMSVFEPFAQGREFVESDALRPPRADRYAREKVRAEQALLTLPDAASWQLHLRPTVVYGPFCGVWTDQIFAAFLAGDVVYYDLNGRIQPLHGEDLSRFILHRAHDFRPGIYNMAGPETMSWQTFFSSFQAIAAKGVLRFSNDSGVGVKQSRLGFYGSNLRELAHAMRREPAFDRMALSVARHLPERVVLFLRTLLLGANEPAPATSTNAPVSDQYMRSFFSEDRLVSSTRLRNDFPTYAPRYMHECRNELERYFRYRFCEDRFV